MGFNSAFKGLMHGTSTSLTNNQHTERILWIAQILDLEFIRFGVSSVETSGD